MAALTRSLFTRLSHSAKTQSIWSMARPLAVLGSPGASSTCRMMPLASRSLNVFTKSSIDRKQRSNLVTMMWSPGSATVTNFLPLGRRSNGRLKADTASSAHMAPHSIRSFFRVRFQNPRAVCSCASRDSPLSTCSSRDTRI